MRILITGATGLLGRQACQALSDRHELIGWARRPAPFPEGVSIALESIDLTDDQSVRSRLMRLQPQVILHTAAMTDVDACERNPPMALAIHRDALERLARGAEQIGSFLIAVSTDYVFDGTLNRPYREQDPPHPINWYGRTKWEGEKAALSLCSHALVVRVSGLFGEGRPNFVLNTIQKLRAGEAVSVVTDQVNCPSYTADLADGIRRLIELVEQDAHSAESAGPLHGVLHLANSGAASRWTVAKKIAQILGAPPTFIHPTTWEKLNRPARRPSDTRMDCRRFAVAVGAPLRTWEEAVTEFIRLILRGIPCYKLERCVKTAILNRPSTGQGS